MVYLVGADVGYRNDQTYYGSVAIAIPKGEKDLRLVLDYRAVNAAIEQTVLLMQTLESMARLFAKMIAFFMLNLLQGCLLMSPSLEVHSIFTMVMPGGILTHKRVPQGVAIATTEFRGARHDVLDGLIDDVCMV